MTAYEETLDLLLNLRAAIDVAVDAIQENASLRRDRDYWKQQHADLLNQSIRHGEEMIGNVLMLAMKDIKPREEEAL